MKPIKSFLFNLLLMLLLLPLGSAGLTPAQASYNTHETNALSQTKFFAGAGYAFNHLTNSQEREYAKEVSQCADAGCKLKAHVKYQLISAKQDVGLVKGAVEGMGTLLKDDVEALMSVFDGMDMDQMVDSVGAMINNPSLIGDMAKAEVDAFKAAYKDLKKSYQTPGFAAAEETGRKFANLFGSLVMRGARAVSGVGMILDIPKVKEAMLAINKLSDSGPDGVGGSNAVSADVTKVERKFWTNSTTFRGNKVYQRNDLIDPKLVDARGRSNIDRMQKGLAPIGPDGKSVSLHHMTQGQHGGIAEMAQTFHQQNSSTIHINPNSTPSGIDRGAFNKWRSDYWKSRANDF